MVEAWTEGACTPDLVDRNVVWITGRRADNVTYGVDRLGKGLARWRAAIAGYHAEVAELIDVGDHVIVVTRHTGRRADTGEPFDRSDATIITLLGGRIVRVQYFRTRAQALRAAGLQAQEDPLEVVRRHTEAHAAGNVEEALATLDPDIEWDSTAIEGGWVDRGLYAVEERARLWREAWDDYRFDVEDYLDAGDRVVVLYHETGTGKGSGIPLDRRGALVHTCGGGRIVHTVAFLDRDDALRSAGLRSARYSAGSILSPAPGSTRAVRRP